MQIPILNGIYADTNGEFRTSYPRNLIPVPKKQGISSGYLKPADGIIELASGPGVDRGGVNWKGVCYRAMGSKLVSVAADGTLTTLGDIGGFDSTVTFDYSFDRLGISSNGNLFYWNGSTLTKVVDNDLGQVVDFIWIDGYFMTTDGNSLVVTELNDPTSVNPLKYGSSEADPDSIKGLLKLRNEAYAINRYTIEVFDNVGGSLFPFQRVAGAMIHRGAIGTYAACVLPLTTFVCVAFLGGARNLVWCYDKWISGDVTTNKIGVFADSVSSHYGSVNGWEFGTLVIYNEAEGVIFHELELIALTGNYAVDAKPTIYTSYSTDGETWSVERPRTAGRQGKRDTRLNWLQQGNMKNWRIQKFRGTSDAHISIARLEARIEPLKN